MIFGPSRLLSPQELRPVSFGSGPSKRATWTVDEIDLCLRQACSIFWIHRSLGKDQSGAFRVVAHQRVRMENNSLHRHIKKER
jgi:hypothetical protein